jgi:hypothetical protein
MGISSQRLQPDPRINSLNEKSIDTTDIGCRMGLLCSLRDGERGFATSPNTKDSLIMF